MKRTHVLDEKEMELLKVVYMSVSEISKKWTMPVRD